MRVSRKAILKDDEGTKPRYSPEEKAAHADRDGKQQFNSRSRGPSGPRLETPRAAGTSAALLHVPERSRIARVTALIEQHRAGLAELCRRFGVRRLYVFGSAASDRLQPSSDVDFVVDMADRQPTGAYADRYLDFGDALEHLLGRRVDLVTEHAMRNPYFRREVESTRRLIYGQPGEEAAV